MLESKGLVEMILNGDYINLKERFDKAIANKIADRIEMKKEEFKTKVRETIR